MSDNELMQKAINYLADEYEAYGEYESAKSIRNSEFSMGTHFALMALKKAISDGNCHSKADDTKIRVPIIPTLTMDAAGTKALCDSGLDNVEDGDTASCWIAMVAASCGQQPEMKNPVEWVVVPLNPTKDMLEAGYEPSAYGPDPGSVWEAMVLSRPNHCPPIEYEALMYKRLHNEWLNKTAWVQDTVMPGELGQHRADVIRERIDNLERKLMGMEKPR